MLAPLVAFVAAIGTKMRAKNFLHMPLLVLCIITQIANAILMAYAVNGMERPNVTWEVNTICSCLIIPSAYIYICNVCGATWKTWNVFTMWAIIPLILLPNIDIELSRESTEMVLHAHLTHAINFYRNGASVYVMYTPNIIIMLQALFAFWRVPGAVRDIHHMRLRFSMKSIVLVSWWFMSFLFIMAVAFLPQSVWVLPWFRWTYFVTYALLAFGFFVQITLRFDKDVILSDEDNESVGVDNYANQFEDLARRFKVLFEVKEFYLNTDITMDDVVERLNTNRSYLAQMVKAEYNTTFTNYVTQMRLTKAEKMMLETDDTLDTIAAECGFRESSSFCRVFKRERGITPNLWRKAKKGV